MPLASPKYPFQDWALSGAPDDPGLYALYDGDQLLCIGVALGLDGSDTIRARLLSHHERNGQGPAATHYKWEITSRPLQRRMEYMKRLERATLRCEEASVRIRRGPQ